MSRLCRLKSYKGIGEDGKWAASEIERLRSELAQYKQGMDAEVLEQCRIIGMGAEREAVLLAKVDRLEKQRDELNSLCQFNERTMADLIKQRDVLLDALETYLPFIPTTTASEGGAAKYSANVAAADKFRTAIASVKGVK